MDFYRHVLIFGIRFCRFVCRVHFTVEGAEKIPQGQFLIVSNHVSQFDPMIMYEYLRDRKLAFISKPENFRIPIAGHVIRKCRFIPVDRSSDRNALDAIRTAISMVRDEGYSIGVFPEGHRNLTREPLLRFKPGCFKVAQRTGIPVLVMCCSGCERISILHRSDVTIRVLGTIDPASCTGTREMAEIAEKMTLFSLTK